MMATFFFALPVSGRGQCLGALSPAAVIFWQIFKISLTTMPISNKIVQVSRVQPLPLAPEAKAQLATIPEILIN